MTDVVDTNTSTTTDATVLNFETSVKPVVVAPQPEPGPPNDAPGGGEQPAGDTERRFTQADLDRIVSDRIKRERQKYGDYDDLKARAAKWAEYEETQKTELERAQEAASKAVAERDQALSAANERLIRAAFLAEAGKSGAQHPEDAYLLADLSAVNIAEDGAVTGVTEQVKALVEAGRLPKAGRPQAPGLDAGAGSGERGQEKALKLTQEEIAMAQKLGVSLEDYQKNKEAKQQK
jgi:hypothetical protein